MDFKGLSSEIIFKDFQEKIRIKMEGFATENKSAVETFLENKMSDANREISFNVCLEFC
jgi:protease-4